MAENYLNQFMTGAYGMMKKPLDIVGFNPLAPFGNTRQDTPPVQLTQPIVDSSEGQPMEEPTSVPTGENLSRWQQFRQRPGSSEALMRLGAGIASGNNWGEGVARGFSGAADAMSNAEKLQAEQAYRRQMLMAKATNRQSTWNRSSQQVRWIDEEGNEHLRGARLKDGEPFIQDANGEWLPAHVVAGTTNWRFVNKSDEQDVEVRAGGIPNAIYYDPITGTPSFNFNREGEQKAFGYALRAITSQRELDNVIARADPTTITGLQESLKRWAAGNANEKITAAVLNSAISESVPQEMQGAAYRFLQSILRVDTGAAYTGTEIANYASAFLPSPGDTPESMAAKRQARGLEALGVASRTGPAAPYLIGLINGKYQTPSFYPDEKPPIASKPSQETKQRKPLGSFQK